MGVSILTGDCREVLRPMIVEGVKVQMCVTSPPYWGLRDYGVDRQMGLEKTPEEYVATMVEVFRGVREVLADDGTLWLVLGDCYSSGARATYDTQSKNKGSAKPPRVRPSTPLGLKPKDLCGIPWRVAFALQGDGWWLRRDIVWHKPNVKPENVEDRPTSAHEYLFLFAKSERYYYDHKAIQEPASGKDLHDLTGQGYQVPGRSPEKGNRYRSGYGGGPGQRPDDHSATSIPWEGNRRNKRSVWSINTEPCPEPHYASFPRALVEPCILAGSRVGDTVLDPFGGTGTVGRVAEDLGRHAILIDLNPAYVTMARQRTAQAAFVLAESRRSG